MMLQLGHRTPSCGLSRCWRLAPAATVLCPQANAQMPQQMTQQTMPSQPCGHGSCRLPAARETAGKVRAHRHRGGGKRWRVHASARLHGPGTTTSPAMLTLHSSAHAAMSCSTKRKNFWTRSTRLAPTCSARQMTSAV